MIRISPTARRQAIVEAALAVGIRKCFVATTVRDVAGEMGCSIVLIHHYFSSMDELLASAFELAAPPPSRERRERRHVRQEPAER